MDDDIAIKVDHVSKKYCKNLKMSMLYGVNDIGRNTLGLSSHSDKLRKDEFWAVDDVSFEVKKGEVLGIIGMNGSGKTTMLKLLNGIFWPDKGKISIRGKTGALIALGAGFHPLLTGRENIYINGAILGMTKNEIDKKFDDIIEFADIEEFIDSPVKFYSSGMFVKLGFSIAINIEPEVLLIDEVLSVGDLSFQNKSLRRMAELREKANAVVFVSHNLEHIRNLCDKVLILEHGKTVFSGETHEAIVKYQRLNEQKRLASVECGRGFELFEHISSGDIISINSGVLDEFGHETNEISVSDKLILFFDLEVKKYIEELYFSVGIHNERGELCIWHVSNEYDIPKFCHFSKGTYRIRARIAFPNLVPGIYTMSFATRDYRTKETYERFVKTKKFLIKGDHISRGIVNTNIEWSMERR